MVVTSGIRVRYRVDDDLPTLLPILQRAHENHRYPIRASAVRADWLAPSGELGAWVAEYNGSVVGHIALHPTAEPGHDAGEDEASAQWQRATGTTADRLAVVSRFVTDGSVPGIGLALLAHAVETAEGAGRAPVLLVEPDGAARGFYGRRGWREIGTAMQQWGEYRVDVVLMVAPGY